MAYVLTVEIRGEKLSVEFPSKKAALAVKAQLKEYEPKVVMTKEVV